MRDVAESVFRRRKLAVRIHVDPPAHDVLALEIARRQAQDLDERAHGRLEGEGARVGDLDEHGTLNSLDIARRWSRLRDCCPR